MTINNTHTTTPRMRLIAWLTLGVYFLVAITMTHIPHVPSELNHFSDKTLHFTGYFVYAALAYVAMGLNFPRWRVLPILILIFFAAFAAMDELTQPMFGRDCDYYDWRADMFGVTTAVVLLTLLRVIGQRLASRPADAPAIGS